METMTLKFPSNPKCKEERAARVRDNQRRHRARVKSHIEELETQLKEVNLKLEEALQRNKYLEKRIEELVREVEVLRILARTPPDAGSRRGTQGQINAVDDDLTSDASLLLALGGEHPTLLQPASRPGIGPGPDLETTTLQKRQPPSISMVSTLPVGDTCQLDKTAYSASPSSIPTTSCKSPPTATTTSSTSRCRQTSESPATTPVDSPLQTVLISSEPLLLSFPSSTLLDSTFSHTQSPSAPVISSSISQSLPTVSAPISTPSLAPDSDFDPMEQDCPHLPPPRPGESTIHCKTAYRIISEQNFRGMDLEVIQGWLGPGFRRAIIAGDGCRVDSQLVMRVLDVVSEG